MQNQRGMTLIEVLIALAVISIALTAIIKATSQSIRSTSYLEEKTVALWMAENKMNEIRVGLVKIPDKGRPLKQKQTMLNHTFEWRAVKTRTPNKHIDKIVVDVFTLNTNQNLMTLQSYVYKTE